MNYDVPPGQRIRMVTILALIGMGAGAILLRAFQLQFWDSPRLKKLALRQHQHTIELKAKRGDLLDLKGDPLAVSQEKAHVYALPEQVKSPETAAEKLSGVLGLPASVLREKLTSQEHFVWLKRGVSFEQAERISALKLAGVNLLPASGRYYPGGSLAANVLGFTRRDDEGQGLEGLEFQYESLLAGSTIRIWQEKDGLNRPIFLSDQGPEFNFRPGEEGEQRFARLFDVESAKGHSLKLTIFRPLQYVAERELEKGIRDSGAKSGCVVAMEPESGRILAMASYPTFDPNRFWEFGQQNFRNRCVVGSYEPGSTFKVFVVATALSEEVIRPQERFFCENGSYILGGETISDTKGYGILSVSEIIAYSSNIGASKIGERLGREKMFQGLKLFGFGEKTGIDFPGESAGLLRPPREWSPVEVGTISFGQGVAVTPLQMVTAVSAIANQGVLMRPYLVESVLKPDGTEVSWHAPQKVRRVLRPQVARQVTEYMKKVVAPGGTGAQAAVPGYTVAGKTGTAQKADDKNPGYLKGKYIVSFMGFLPADQPRLAMMVVVDEPQGEKVWGGTIAAPIFQAIAKKAMVLLKVPAETGGPVIAAAEEETIVPSPLDKRRQSWEAISKTTVTREGALVMADLRGLTAREALRALKSFPGEVELWGSGVVIGQFPAPGLLLSGQKVVRLRLGAEP